MRFARPELLWLLVIAPGLAVWLWLAARRRRRALASFAEEALMARLVEAAPARRLLLKGTLLVAGCAFLALALARPQWGSTLEQVSRKGVDVMLAIDISESMLAEDLKPGRLRKALAEASALLDRLEGDRVGLAAFAGSGGVLCPLTLDYSAVRLFLDSLEPGMISYPGSSLAEGIRAAERAFGAEQRKHKVIVLISDGEDQISDEEAIQAAAEAASAGTVIHVLGTGTPAGEPIPLRARDGSLTGYRKDAQGRVITSRLNEDLLQKVSQAGGGLHLTATAAETELERLAEAIAGMDKKEMQARLTTQYEERYQVPLGIALLALAAESLLSRRRRLRPALLALLALLAIASPAQAASAASLVDEGNRLYRAGRLAEALEAYRKAQRLDPGSPALAYNIGNVLYKQQEFEKAYDSYRQAFSARERPLAEGARFNAGNAHFAQKNWPEAIRHYREALRMDPSDQDAKKNLELAILQMQEQQKKQQQQQDQDKDQDEQQDQQKSRPEPESDQSPRDAPRPQPPDPSRDQTGGQPLTRQEAMRILDALKEQDKPPKERLKVPPPDRRPERDW